MKIEAVFNKLVFSDSEQRFRFFNAPDYNTLVKQLIDMSPEHKIILRISIEEEYEKYDKD